MRLLIDSDMARMPRNCHECPLGMGTICFWMPSDVDEDRPQEDRPEWCPLSEYKEPTKFEIKHAISNTDSPKGMDELDYLVLMSSIYEALAKLYGDEPTVYRPSEEVAHDEG